MTAVRLSSRNFTQILALSAGVTANVIDAGAVGRNSVNISVNGGRPWDNNIVLNGMNADNPMAQGFDDAPDKTRVPVPAPDAIEEFKVQTGLYGRMGTDKEKSVCDSFGRTHDHENLFVVGAPTQPTGGCTNGTLTFVALTLRSAGEIAKGFRLKA